MIWGARLSRISVTSPFWLGVLWEDLRCVLVPTPFFFPLFQFAQMCSGLGPRNIQDFAIRRTSKPDGALISHGSLLNLSEGGGFKGRFVQLSGARSSFCSLRTRETAWGALGHACICPLTFPGGHLFRLAPFRAGQVLKVYECPLWRGGFLVSPVGKWARGDATLF